MDEVDPAIEAMIAEAVETEVVQVPVAPRPPLPWARGLWLLGASFIAAILVVPYAVALLEQSKEKLPQGLMPVVMVVEVVFETGLSAAAIGLGLGLGPRVGLGAPLLAGMDGTGHGRRRALRAVAAAVGWGGLLGLAILGLAKVFEPLMPTTGQAFKTPSAWAGFFASFGAGIREEVWLRFGFLTFLVWLAWRVSRGRTAGPATFWTANVLAALLFGAMHLPQAHALIGLNAALVAYALIGNGVPGLVWGWLYRRDGLVAAMISHTVADLVMKVIFPALGH